MSFSDQEISRLREAFASQAHEATERADCPEPERLWQATHGELPTAEIQDLVDHTAQLPELRRGLAVGPTSWRSRGNPPSGNSQLGNRRSEPPGGWLPPRQRYWCS